MTNLIALSAEETETLKQAITLAAKRYWHFARQIREEGILPEEVSDSLAKRAGATAALLDKIG